jgi:hypothetical protein
MSPHIRHFVHPLPPEGERFPLGRPGGETWPPRFPTACGSLPPEGALLSLGRPGGEQS